MKKYILTILLLLPYVLFCQARENTKLPIISNPKGIVTTATGWIKDAAGQWQKGKNKIPYLLDEGYEKLKDYQHYSLGDERENFISIDIRDIKIGDSTYVLLLKKYNDGFYDYETIQSGWNPKKSYKYYVFNNSELSKITNAELNKNSELEIKLLYDGTVEYINLDKISNISLAKEINTKILSDDILKNDYLFFKIAPFKEKNIVQFYFTTDGLTPFNDKYYETSYQQFVKLIKLK